VRSGRSRLLPALFALSLSGGCVSASEGGQMRSDIDQLRTELAEMDKREDDRRADLGKRLASVDRRLEELEGTLSGMRQADADSGVQMEKVIAEVQQLRGDVEEARFQLGETKKSVAGILERPPVSVAAAEGAPRLAADALMDGQPIPEDTEALFDLAKKLFDEKKFVEAGQAFDLLTTRVGEDPAMADGAWFYKGESHYARAGTLTDKRAQADAYRQAVLSYQRVLQVPKAKMADGALFKIGLAFEALDFSDEAQVFYEELLSKHPKSSLAGEAKKRLAAVQQKAVASKKKKR
jgi:TolA-binding protein